tara:strand:+ start:1554 stop:1694 length:141 start_codon:yes stop_codon:yes gene_type:complete
LEFGVCKVFIDNDIFFVTAEKKKVLNNLQKPIKLNPMSLGVTGIGF